MSVSEIFLNFSYIVAVSFLLVGQTQATMRSRPRRPLIKTSHLTNVDIFLCNMVDIIRLMCFIELEL